MSVTEVLEDEWLIVRNSGEIPEITYHAALYYLGKDPLGPKLELSSGQKQYLKEAAVDRYQEIVLRDIQIENFSKTIYRGIRRTIYNWHRYEAFCARQELECRQFRKTVSAALLLFLEQGLDATDESLPKQFLNCSVKELQQFMEDLGKKEQLPEGISKHTQTDTNLTEGD